MVGKKVEKQPLARKRKVTEPKYHLDYKSRTNSIGSFPCPICKAKFTLKSSMKNHERIHYTKEIKKKKDKRETKNLGPTMVRVHQEMVDEYEQHIPSEDDQLIYGSPMHDGDDEGGDDLLKGVNKVIYEDDDPSLLHGEDVVGGQPLLSESDSEENEAPTPTIIQTQDDIEYRNEYYKENMKLDFAMPPPWDHSATLEKALQGQSDENTFTDVFEDDELNRDILQFTELAGVSMSNQERLHEILMTHLSEEKQDQLLTPRKRLEFVNMSQHKGIPFTSHNLYTGPLYINTTMQLADSTVVLISMLQDPNIDKQVVSNEYIYSYTFINNFSFF